jgi:nuclear pore complex protein Nup155
VPNFLTGFAEEDPLVQIVVDSTRNILYTRSEKGTLGLYDLGPNGEAMEKITSMTSQVWLDYKLCMCDMLHTWGKSSLSICDVTDMASLNVVLV